MKTLIAFEFKKLLGRRAVWAALLLCAAIFVLGNAGDIVRALDGTVGGMREVYSRYEDMALNDALHRQILKDFQSYAIARPDEFQQTNGDMGYWVAFPANGHDYGVSLAYENLYFMDTQEKYEAEWENAKAELADGGAALAPQVRDWYVRLTSQPPFIPIIHYELAWTTDFASDLDSAEWMTNVRNAGLFGMLLLLLLALWGAPGLAGERAARMEPVLLSAKLRKHAVMAKALATCLAGVLAAVLLCALEMAFKAAIFGLNGWNLPMGGHGTGDIRLAAWAVSVFVTMLACAACAAITAAATSMARGNLSALGLAAAMLAAQFGLRVAASGLESQWMLAHGVISGDQVPQWIRAVGYAAWALPANRVLMQQMSLGNIPNVATLAWQIALPAALLALGLWLAPKFYLRRRRA